MALISSTLILLHESSNLTFANNSAKEFGGAIYVDPDHFEYTYQIGYNYYYINTYCLYDTNPNATETYYFNFVHNQAQIAGDDVYGASLACMV